MITLPPVRRVTLQSFWLAICLFGGLLLGSLLSLLVSFSWALCGAGIAVVLALPGLLWPQMMVLPYRVWNRLAREVARFASLILMSTCFYIVLVAVGRAGSTLNLAHSMAPPSSWVPRDTLAPTTYPYQHGIPTNDSRSRGWIASLVSWGRASGNLWVCCLVPFLILLSVFASEQESNVPTDIYTLF